MTFLAVLAIGLIQDRPPVLNTRLGDTWRYRLIQSFVPLDAHSDQEEERFTFEITAKVTGTKTGGQDWDFVQRLTAHRFDGQDMDLPKAKEDLVQRIAVAPSGLRTFDIPRFADPVEFRIDRLIWFGFPVTRGATSWTTEWPMIEGEWAPKAQVSYRRVGKTERLGRPCLLFSVQYKELSGQKPMSAEGRAEVDEATGVLAGLNLTASPILTPGGEEYQRLKVTVDLLEVKPKTPLPRNRN